MKNTKKKSQNGGGHTNSKSRISKSFQSPHLNTKHSPHQRSKESVIHLHHKSVRCLRIPYQILPPRSATSTATPIKKCNAQQERRMVLVVVLASAGRESLRELNSVPPLCTYRRSCLKVTPEKNVIMKRRERSVSFNRVLEVQRLPNNTRLSPMLFTRSTGKSRKRPGGTG